MKLGEDRSLPSCSSPTEQVVGLPGDRSRQAPAAAAGARTRRACFRGFNPRVSGASAPRWPSPGRCRARLRRVRGPAAPRTARPRVGGVARPPRRARRSGGAARSPSLTVSPTRAAASPAGSHLRIPPLGSEGRRIPRRLFGEAPARPLTSLAVGRASRGRRCAGLPCVSVCMCVFQMSELHLGAWSFGVFLRALLHLCCW